MTNEEAYQEVLDHWERMASIVASDPKALPLNDKECGFCVKARKDKGDTIGHICYYCIVPEVYGMQCSYIEFILAGQAAINCDYEFVKGDRLRRIHKVIKELKLRQSELIGKE